MCETLRKSCFSANSGISWCDWSIWAVDFSEGEGLVNAYWTDRIWDVWHTDCRDKTKTFFIHFFFVRTTLVFGYCEHREDHNQKPAHRHIPHSHQSCHSMLLKQLTCCRGGNTLLRRMQATTQLSTLIRNRGICNCIDYHKKGVSTL